jgi:plasmid maintenance system antidote protein VapI
VTTDFRAAVSESLARRCLSRHALAKASGVPLASVYDFLAGKGGLTADNLARLFDALGMGITLPKAKGRK